MDTFSWPLSAVYSARGVIAAVALATYTTVAFAGASVSVPLEKGPDGQINANVGLQKHTGEPNSVGGSFNTKSGNSGGASVTTNGNVSVSAGSNGAAATVTVGPSGTSIGGTLTVPPPEFTKTNESPLEAPKLIPMESASPSPSAELHVPGFVEPLSPPPQGGEEEED